jgi:hypothetical protein
LARVLLVRQRVELRRELVLRLVALALSLAKVLHLASALGMARWQVRALLVRERGRALDTLAITPLPVMAAWTLAVRPRWAAATRWMVARLSADLVRWALAVLVDLERLRPPIPTQPAPALPLLQTPT